LFNSLTTPSNALSAALAPTRSATALAMYRLRLTDSRAAAWLART
jgi:hypothetical protein